jgi:hypothetical protein
MSPSLLLVGLATSWAASPPSVDAAVKTGARSPTDAAVIVGNEDYAFLPDVPYARRDATAFHDWAVYTAGIPADRVAMLDQGADRDQIVRALDVAAQATGTVWVYFSGHGAVLPDSGQRVLLGNDTKPELASLASRGLPLTDVVARLGGKPSRIVLVLDACHAGTGRAGEPLIPGARLAVPASVAPITDARVVEWSAAAPGELAGPLDVTAHGAFTYFALGALRGWADGEVDGARDGSVTTDEARMYVARMLRAAQKAAQHPTLRGPLDVVVAKGAKEVGPDAAAIAGWMTAAPGPSGMPATPGAVFREDFSTIPAGQVPAGWLGVEHLMVKKDARASFLVPFDPGPARITIPVKPPDDFKITLVASVASGSWETTPNLYVTTGGLVAGLDARHEHYEVVLGNVRQAVKVPLDTQFDLVVQKQGDVIRVLLGGTELALARYPGVKPGSSIVLDTTAATSLLAEGPDVAQPMSNLRLYAVKVEPLVTP